MTKSATRPECGDHTIMFITMNFMRAVNSVGTHLLHNTYKQTKCMSLVLTHCMLFLHCILLPWPTLSLGLIQVNNNDIIDRGWGDKFVQKTQALPTYTNTCVHTHTHAVFKECIQTFQQSITHTQLTLL